MFDAFFCEVPEYVRYLYELYAALGGRIITDADLPGDATVADFLDLNYPYYVNCTGAGAPEFLIPGQSEQCEEGAGFEPLWDGDRGHFIRGHYLRVDFKEIITLNKRFFSYNYKPTPDIYRTASGDPADVYCYPRSDAWILGGSRQAGEVVDGQWRAIDEAGSYLDDAAFGHSDPFRVAYSDPPAYVDIPRPILDLNADLLFNITGGRLDLKTLVREKSRDETSTIVEPGIGYRFVRNDDTRSVRLGVSAVRRPGELKYVVHNYGHGGSGYTLSWGCAYDILRHLDAVSSLDSGREPAEQRKKFVIGHSATRLVLQDLTARLIDEELKRAER
jgi:D-amino-acid oxidase